VEYVVNSIVSNQHIFRLWSWLSAHRLAVVAVLFWLSTAVILRHYMQANNLALSDLIHQLETVLRVSWFGPLLYIAVYTLRPLALFPAWVLAVLGGSVFGLWPGFAYALLAGTASAIIPYAVGRGFASPRQDTRQIVVGDESLRQRFVRMLRRNPFQATLIMRLMYLPYDAVSVLVGSLRIPFPAFISATALGNLGGTLSFTGIGASVAGNIFDGDIALNPTTFAFLAVILIFSVAVSRVLKRRQQSAAEQGK
jgi:uncharacterized membrane protein YdjX (TVP38/TMEM64 family)